METNQNTGVIVEQRETDYVAGASPVFNENRVSTFDWTQFVRPGERQSSPSLDAMDCITQAICNSFETQVEWMIANSLLSALWMKTAHDLGFFDIDGRFRISRRFTAKASNTTAQGNSFQRVADSIRNIGIVAESKYPSNTDGFNWATYYQALTPDLTTLAQKSLSLYSALYEQVASVGQELNHSPIVILTHVASGWFTQDPVQKEDGPVQHATQVFKKDTVYYDEDSYPQFIKHLAGDYIIPFAYKFIVSPIDPGNPVVTPPPFKFLKDMSYGETSEDVRQLRIRLGISAGKTYDDNLRAAVFSYQLNHIINSPSTLWEVITLQGRRAGSKTRACLNQ